MKVKELEADDSDAHRLSQQRVELEAGEFYEREFEDLSDFASVAALIETLQGEAEIEFQGPPGPNLSSVNKVRLFAGKLTQGITKIAVRIKAVTKTAVRVTVTFLKKEGRDALKRMSCKACKTLLRVSINVLLTSMGIPPMSIDIPFAEHFDLAGVIKHLGMIVHSAGTMLPEGLSQFFSGISPAFWIGLQGVFGVADFVTGHIDRGLEAGCRVIGCCQEIKG